MAQFCTKCGTPLAEGMSFCTGCGATIGGASAPATPGPAAPAPATPQPAPMPAMAAPSPAPAAPVAAAPAAKSGSPVVKIILIVVAVFIFVGLVSAASCVYFVYRAKQRVAQFEKQVKATYPAPTGTREVRSQPAAPATPGAAPTAAPSEQTGPVVDTGVPTYPGATPAGGGGQVSMPTGTVKTQQYLTSDSVDKVVAFYKDKLGPTAMTSQNGEQALVQVLGANGVISVVIAPDSSSGKTKISISNIAK